jgi:hypothetical protein
LLYTFKVKQDYIGIGFQVWFIQDSGVYSGFALDRFNYTNIINSIIFHTQVEQYSDDFHSIIFYTQVEQYSDDFHSIIFYTQVEQYSDDFHKVTRSYLGRCCCTLKIYLNSKKFSWNSPDIKGNIRFCYQAYTCNIK